jgi:hypothetical protein
MLLLGAVEGRPAGDQVVQHRASAYMSARQSSVSPSSCSGDM